MCFENLIPIIKIIGQTGNPEMAYYIFKNTNLIYKKSADIVANHNSCNIAKVLYIHKSRNNII